MTHDPVAPIDLKLSNITKVYPGVVALQDVDLEISGGEIVGLIGENGAGKSTLMKVLGGLVLPDQGEIQIDGQVVGPLNPADAGAFGIAFVHQELHSFTNLDVAGNVLLGREITSAILKRLDLRAMAAEVQPILEMLGTRFGPNEPVADLSLADRQLVEIAKALSMRARLIILDEPTSSLTLVETERLLRVLDQLRSQGVAILFISHRLAEVEAVADRIVCLRDGEIAGELAVPDIEKDKMIQMMIGRDVGSLFDKARHEISETVLELRRVKTTAFPNSEVDLSLHAGEILALAGLVGAGRTELAVAIFGIDPVVSGEILLEGKPLPGLSVMASMQRGLCLVPENRKEQGLFLDFPVVQNISLPNLNSFSRNGLIDTRSEMALAEQSRDQLSIKVAALTSAVAELSGGNQQKVVLAKWLALKPRVIIFDEPTRGVDVGSKSEFYHLMQGLAKEGVGILMISSDMEEVIGISDRVAVMCRGRIAGTLNADELSEENILRLAVG